MAGPEKVTFTVGDDDAGRRLDQVLAARVPGLSRRQARVLLDIGGVFVDGRRVKVAGGRRAPARRSSPCWAARWRGRRGGRGGRRAPTTSASCRLTPSCSRTRRSSSSTSRPACWRRRRRRATATTWSRCSSGARRTARASWSSTASTSRRAASSCSPRSPHANRVLSERFRTHDLERAYLAVVAGAFPDGLTRIDKPVGGRPAVTHVGVRERFGARATLLDCRLETGRTHQIRLHALAAGHPVHRRRSLRRRRFARRPRRGWRCTRRRSASLTPARARRCRSPAPGRPIWRPGLDRLRGQASRPMRRLGGRGLGDGGAELLAQREVVVADGEAEELAQRLVRDGDAAELLGRGGARRWRRAPASRMTIRAAVARSPHRRRPVRLPIWWTTERQRSELQEVVPSPWNSSTSCFETL